MKTILVDAIGTFILIDSGIFKEMYELLGSYPHRKIILTSANDEQMRKFNLDKMPYEVFTLKHNPEKMDPQYYETMLKHFGLRPVDVIYFEHHDGAVESARSVGIKTYHYDENKKDLKALKKFLDKNIK